MPHRIIIWLIAGLLLFIVVPTYAQTEDSEMIAFQSNMDGDYDIYLLNLADDELINITNNTDIDDMYPFWSQDGRVAYLSYEHYEDEEIPSPCIWSAGDITCLPFPYYDRMAWSADGRLALNNFHDVLVWDGQAAISVTASGIEFVTIMTWSPDGILMYSASTNGQSDIYLWDGTGTTRLVDNLDNIGFGWSADGRLVYRSEVNTQERRIGGDLYVWDGQQSLNITNTASERTLRRRLYNHPSWSADGRLTFTMSSEANTSNIMVWDGQTVTNITNDSLQNYHQPRWSADGRLAYVASPYHETQTLYVWDGSTQTSIFESEEGIRGLDWSRTGERLLFASTARDCNNIYVWDGSSVVNVTDNAFNNGSAVWQP